MRKMGLGGAAATISAAAAEGEAAKAAIRRRGGTGGEERRGLRRARCARLDATETLLTLLRERLRSDDEGAE